MNFLAHNFLSFQRPGLIVGNYLGDFIRNPEVRLLPEAVQTGVVVHRMIDSYTDTHEQVKSATRLLHPTMGKYAPVVIDIYFDFLLSKRWSDFHPQPLEQYCEVAYKVLLRHRHLMSDRIANRMQRMVTDRWLENYQTYSGLQRIFSFLSKRAKFRSNLGVAPKILKPMEEELEEIFMRFFPDVIIHIRTFLEETKNQKTDGPE